MQAALEGTGRNITIYRCIAVCFEWCAGGGQVVGAGVTRRSEQKAVLADKNKESAASDVSCLMQTL